MAPSPPKPWERSSAPAPAASTLTTTSASTSTPPATSTPSVPALPDRPATMTTSPLYGGATTTTTSPYGATAYSPARPYGAAGLGSYGSSYGTGYGGYGAGGYGSMGMGGYGAGGGYGMGGYGMGGYGMGGMGGFGGMGGMGGYGMMPGGGVSPEELSLSQRMEHGTAQTFQMLQAIVGAFGGFAQMLESTFMATHSSFFAMIGVAEQFGHLRNYLGQVLSIFALVRWIKGVLYRITGREPPPASGGISSADFKAFESGGAAGGPAQAKPKLAKKPLFVFLLTVVGLPWLMNRLVRLITQRQAAEAARLAAAASSGPAPQFDQFGRPVPPSPSSVPLDPSQLVFMRAIHAYAPPPEAADKELAFEKDDIIAVLSTKEERSQMGWWMGRKRDGKVGWVPGTYLGEIPGLNAGAKKSVGGPPSPPAAAVEGDKTT
ncbi:hypothetical protein JCM11491_005662 [Sporobolomyces phaffii]